MLQGIPDTVALRRYLLVLFSGKSADAGNVVVTDLTFGDIEDIDELPAARALLTISGLDIRALIAEWPSVEGVSCNAGHLYLLGCYRSTNRKQEETKEHEDNRSWSTVVVDRKSVV